MKRRILVDDRMLPQKLKFKEWDTLVRQSGG